MFHNLPIPDECIKLWKACQSFVPRLISDIEPRNKDVKITSSKPLTPTTDTIYLIKSGIISEKYHGQLIVHYEEGDLVNADSLYRIKDISYENDFAVVVDEYNSNTFLNAILNDHSKFESWNNYLSYKNESFQLLLCHFSHQDAEFNPEYRAYKAGETIIVENTEGDEVFTLMSGSAKVMINNVDVGEIQEDEIFGAIAALTQTKRTASIIAKTNCETIVVKSESFKGLLEARPDTVQKLVTDMARTIVSCNEKIIELSV